MQLSIAKDRLVTMLSAAASSAAQKSPLQGHTMTLLEASDGALRVRATDGYVGVDSTSESAVKAPGSAAVEARGTYDLVKALPSGDVMIKSTAGHLEFKAGKAARFKVKVFEVEMPVHPDLSEATSVVSVNAAELLTALKAGSYARDVDESRPQAAILLHACGQELRVVTACTAGLAVANVVAECVERELVMSSRCLSELSRLCEATKDGSVTVSSYGPTAVFAANGTTLWARMRDDKALPYEKLMKSCRGKHTVHVQRNALLEALKRVALVAARSKREGMLSLTFCDGQLRLAADSGGDEASDVVDCDATVETSLAVAPERLLAAVSASRDDELAIEFTGPREPLVLRGDAYTAIVMTVLRS